MWADPTPRLPFAAIGIWLVATASCAADDPLPPRDFDLLVSSRSTNSVKRYHGTTGDYIDDFIAPGAGGLATTQEVLQAPDGSLVVSGRGTDAILRFDASTGAFLGEFSTGQPYPSQPR